MKRVIGLLKIAKITAYSQAGETKDVTASGRLEETGGVSVMRLDVSTAAPLDSELAVSVDFDIPGLARFFGDRRHKEFWCSPCFGESLREADNNIQGFIAELEDGSFTVILPLVSDDYKAVLIGTPENLLRAQVYSWQKGLNTCKCPVFVAASGENPFELLKICAETAVKVLKKDLKLIGEREYPEIFEYLGWCSWDAFQIRVDEASVKAKCEEFKQKGIPVKWMMLDDMWAYVRDFHGASYKTREEMFALMQRSKLYSFRADPKRFPNGLKGMVDIAKSYGISAGAWHPTTGYWKGIDKSGDIYNEYKDCLIDTYEDVCIPSFETDKAYRFFAAFHDYLKSCGIEFVKIDNQSINRRYYKGLATVGKTASSYHKALERSVKEHFGGKMINCMGMASEDMWNRSDSPVSRCSDDFIPEDRAWFVKHILQCSYNSLIQGLFYYEDFDMWWTDDSQALKNSILRAISGGPVYVSDTLGRSNAEILSPLCLENGRILRCDKPAVPARDCLCTDPTKSGKAFKLQNTANGCGILAVFNLSQDNKPVSATLSPADIEGLCGEEFGVYDNLERKLTVLRAGESMTVTLKNNDCFGLYNIVPLKDGNGVIGLVDKFIAPLTYIIDKNGEPEFVKKGKWAQVKNGKLIFNE